MFLKSLYEENTHQRFLSSLIYSLYPLSSSSFVYAFANVLMKCAVTMVSNVSDSSDAWPGMLLHAHMLTHSVMPHRAGHTHMRTYTCICANRYALVCMHICVSVYKECVCMSAKWRMSGWNSCSFLHEKRNFLLPLCKMRSVSQDINQSAMLRLNAGS